LPLLNLNINSLVLNAILPLSIIRASRRPAQPYLNHKVTVNVSVLAHFDRGVVARFG
jgi:hypothetical protein